MATFILERRAKKTGPTPASGAHAELLAEMSEATVALGKLIELERSGIYDNLGENFWVGSDSVLAMTQKLVKLAEQRIGEMRDATPR
jgi:hypothetical protein